MYGNSLIQAAQAISGICYSLAVILSKSMFSFERITAESHLALYGYSGIHVHEQID